MPGADKRKTKGELEAALMLARADLEIARHDLAKERAASEALRLKVKALVDRVSDYVDYNAGVILELRDQRSAFAERARVAMEQRDRAEALILAEADKTHAIDARKGLETIDRFAGECPHCGRRDPWWSRLMSWLGGL